MSNIERMPDINDEEVSRLHDVVLRWVQAKNTPTESKKKPHKRDTPPTPARKKQTTNSDIPRTYGSRRAGVILVLLAVALLSTAFGLWWLWSEQFSAAAASVIPVPVAMVNNDFIWHSEWSVEVAALNHYYDADESVSARPSSVEIKQHVLERLIEQQLVKQLAKRYTVSVSDEELIAQLRSLSVEAGSPEELESQVRELYDWDMDQFAQFVIAPFMLKSKLHQAVMLDDRINYDVRRRAEEIRQMIVAGKETFVDAAKKYSQDVTAIQGGDVGYFKPEEMTPEFTAAIEKLTPGEVSEVVKTQFGYHIIKLTERLIGEDTAESQVRAQHILIRSEGIDEYLNKYQEQSRIWRFLTLQ